MRRPKLSHSPKQSSEPARDCATCPRLRDFRLTNQAKEPDWFNAPVPSFGDSNAQVLIVGLAPGLKGANKTGRPFTGDYAGDLLYATLDKFGFSSGQYQAHPNDGLTLKNCMITNAVRCVPPENKPVGAEIKNCRPYLNAQISDLKHVRAILALGLIAHKSVLASMGAKQSAYKFAHAEHHEIDGQPHLFDSYHCSRYNTNTGRLTPEMFEGVFESICAFLND